jgi:hypothetical protein
MHGVSMHGVSTHGVACDLMVYEQQQAACEAVA